MHTIEEICSNVNVFGGRYKLKWKGFLKISLLLYKECAPSFSYEIQWDRYRCPTVSLTNKQVVIRRNGTFPSGLVWCLGHKGSFFLFFCVHFFRVGVQSSHWVDHVWFSRCPCMCALLHWQILNFLEDRQLDITHPYTQPVVFTR